MSNILTPGTVAPDFTLHVTPSFFINGRRHDGTFEYDDLVAAIEERIAPK